MNILKESFINNYMIKGKNMKISKMVKVVIALCVIIIMVIVIKMMTVAKENEISNDLFFYEKKGDFYFDEFLDNGGATSDEKVAEFLMKKLGDQVNVKNIFSNIFSCSTFQIKSADGYLTGRNFDFTRCRAAILKVKPKNGYKSISTIDIDFIGSIYNKVPDNLKPYILYYAPLDGMNEKGVVVAVNMIEDNENINQNEKEKNITTTTAIRLILDKAKDVEEAIELLKNYNMHASKGMVIHFFISDASGKSVAVEYIDNKMSVLDTKILTNFYLTEGKKYGIGTTESHKRYDILKENILTSKDYEINDAMSLLSKVSKKNFATFATTEWSIVFDQNNLTYNLCHRENYSKTFTYNLK